MTKSISKLNLDIIHSKSLLSSTVLDTWNKQQEQINNLLKPSILDSMLKQQYQLSNIFDTSGFDAIRKQQEQFSSIFKSNIFEALTKQQTQISSHLNRSASEIIKNQRLHIISRLSEASVVNMVFKEQKNFNNLLSSSVLNSIKIAPSLLSELSSINSIAKVFQQKAVYPDMLKTIEQSFSFNLLQDINKENISFDDTVELVQESFSDQLKNTPEGLISFEGMVQILFAIILFLYSQASSFESEENISRKIEQLETHVIDQITRLLPREDEANYYIVKRAVNLRIQYNTKSPVINVLYPNQRVELIERNKKWIYVKYFDHIEGIPKMGWVYKKYLQMEK